jgi:hypothetical protein
LIQALRLWRGSSFPSTFCIGVLGKVFGGSFEKRGNCLKAFALTLFSPFVTVENTWPLVQ